MVMILAFSRAAAKHVWAGGVLHAPRRMAGVILGFWSELLFAIGSAINDVAAALMRLAIRCLHS